MTYPEGPVGEAEAEAIIEDLRALRDEPPPSDPASGGCVLAIVSIITIVLMPFIGRAFELSGRVMGGVGAVLALAGVCGGLLGVFGGGLISGRVTRAVERAIDELLGEHPDGDPDRRRRAAIRVLDGAYHSRGPTTVSTFERSDVRRRLGDALVYVERIERFLVDREEIHPVFTLPDDASEGGP